MRQLSPIIIVMLKVFLVENTEEGFIALKDLMHGLYHDVASKKLWYKDPWLT